MKTIPTTEKVEVKDYPYGFRLRTTLYDTVEFSPKKGYRHVTQTINPKNGKPNAPKKSTYYPLLVRYYNEEGHIKSTVFDFNGHEAINMGTKFVSENFGLFTSEETNYLYGYISTMSLIDCKSAVIYTGAKFEDLKPLYEGFWKLAKEGMTDGLNHFGELQLDVEAIKATAIEGYNPFRTVEANVL